MFPIEHSFLYSYSNIRWRIFSHLSSRDVTDRLNFKLHLIRSHDWNVTGLCICSNLRIKVAEEKRCFVVTVFQGSQVSSPTTVLTYIRMMMFFFFFFFCMFVVTSSFTHRVVVHFTVLTSVLNLTIISKGNIGPKLWHKMLFFFFCYLINLHVMSVVWASPDS
jgi:hypothetical protein